jgi:hypothetical protein
LSAPLSIPEWLPPAVERQARMLHDQAFKSGSVETAALVQRLTSDPRMRHVWAELKKRRRRNYRPTMRLTHPATVPPSVDPDREDFDLDARVWCVPAPGDAAARQAVAAGLFFHFAVSFQLLGAAAIPARLLDRSSAVDVDDPLVVERGRGDAEARGYVICLLQKSAELFGDPLLRTVATTASVAFDRGIHWRSVRQWWEQPRLRKSSKPLTPKVAATGVRRRS